MARARYYRTPREDRGPGEPDAVIHRYRGPRAVGLALAEVVPLFGGCAIPDAAAQVVVLSPHERASGRPGCAVEDVATLAARALALAHGDAAQREALSCALSALGV